MWEEIGLDVCFSIEVYFSENGAYVFYLVLGMEGIPYHFI